jgi:S1-C subfamily serine protease
VRRSIHQVEAVAKQKASSALVEMYDAHPVVVNSGSVEVAKRMFLRLGSIAWLLICFTFVSPVRVSAQDAPEISDDQLKQAESIEQHRIAAIEKVIGSVVAIYGLDRQGGGSGVIIDPSGIAVTNHHVIAGAGIQGLGGLNDGQLYPWTLIGTDPGGDVALIQMTGRETFPSSPLGNSDLVEVGDWTLAMGNPFLLAEDQTPTVTLGIVSGVKRYQPGAGANQLVYGNCIQVDSSINPGNSGGPLFNLLGEVIGINGRGSFKDRGRVNVGLGYAISSNQVKNFLPELLATKLTEHATLDAGFSDRGDKVVCSRLDRESPIARAGLRLSDQLLEFEGVSIKSANQFKNLICTLPEDWPAALKIRDAAGDVKMMRVRTFGLPYPKKPQTEPLPPPSPPEDRDPGDDSDPEDGPSDPQQKQRAEDLKREMVALLSAVPGEVRDAATNRKYANLAVNRWLENARLTRPGDDGDADRRCLKVNAQVKQDGQPVGRQTMWLVGGDRGRVVHEMDAQNRYSSFRFDAEKCLVQSEPNGKAKKVTLSEARDALPALQTMVLAKLLYGGKNSAKDQKPKRETAVFDSFGSLITEGAGKTNERLAWRLKLLDFDLDETYLWFAMATERTGLRPQLVKVANDKDNESGAVRFEDWRPLGSGRFPYRFVYVESLAEAETMQVEVNSVKWVELDAADWNEDRGSDE